MQSHWWCRIRIDAAMALGATAHLLEDTSAMDKLIQFYSDRCFDKDTHRPKQHMFDNLAEQFVNQVWQDGSGSFRSLARNECSLISQTHGRGQLKMSEALEKK